MTHAIYYEVNIEDSDLEEVLKEVKSQPLSIYKLESIVKNITDSTMSVTSSEATQIVKEVFCLFREYLFQNKDFRLGWTYPKLVTSVKNQLRIVYPSTSFLKEDRSFLSEEDIKYFEENNAWKAKRRGEWKLAKNELNSFLKDEIPLYRENIKNFSTESICAMIVCLKFFKESFDFQKELMVELSLRKDNGDVFDFESYIKKEFLALPKATLDFSDFAKTLKDLKL